MKIPQYVSDCFAKIYFWTFPRNTVSVLVCFMPDLILHYALTKALKNNDKENDKSINYAIEKKSRNENCDRNATRDATERLVS